MKTYNDPKAINLSYSSIENLATLVAKRFNFDTRQDIQSFVAKLGGKIHSRSIYNTESFSTSLLIHGDNNFEIFIPESVSEEIVNQNIAHELGHYFIHYLFSKYVLRNLVEKTSTKRVDEEVVDFEANSFMAAFLLPLKEVRNYHRQHQKLDIYNMSKYFKITPSLMVKRIRDINLMNENKIS